MKIFGTVVFLLSAVAAGKGQSVLILESDSLFDMRQIHAARKAEMWLLDGSGDPLFSRTFNPPKEEIKAMSDKLKKILLPGFYTLGASSQHFVSLPRGDKHAILTYVSIDANYKIKYLGQLRVELRSMKQNFIISDVKVVGPEALPKFSNEKEIVDRYKVSVEERKKHPLPPMPPDLPR